MLIKKETIMNNQRRKQMAEVIRSIEDARNLLETIKDEEQEAYDNMPESLQEGEKGSAMSEKIDSMESVFDDLERAVDSLNEVIE